MRPRFWIQLPVLFLFLVGCNMPTKRTNTASSPEGDAVGTAAALTAAVYITQLAGSAVPSIQATLTEPPPSATSSPTGTPLPTTTPTQIPCNRASFVKDVNYPDNEEVGIGANFTKTWRLKNNGSCTWTSGYSLIFDHGDRMNAPDSVQLTSGTVPPGGTVDVSVNLKAPDSSGTYQSFFKLRASDNNVFGVNADGQGPFWVKIVVPEAAAGPDLRVTEMFFSMSPAKMGVPFTVTVKVKNKGDTSAGAFTVQWWSSHSMVAKEWSVPSLAPNEEKTLTFEYTYGSWSTYDVKAVADSGFDVDESNEDNNVREATLPVQP